MMPGASIEPGISVFETSWRDSEHVHFADSGHFVMFDQFERFVAVLTRFLAEH